LILFLLVGGPAARGDKIVTVNGQTLEGVIKDENAFNVRIDVRGVIVPVPRERIKTIARSTVDENVRACLDRAQETLSRNDISTARTLVNQARTLNTRDAALIDNINRLDKDITDQAKRGGTAEERRLTAEETLRRANDAFDKIKIDEGNELLIQALVTDPTYETAHQKINELIKTGSRKDQLMLAAEYFNQVLYPDHLRLDSPVIALLPAVYANLIELFENSADTLKAKHYADLLKNLAQAFATHSTWKAGAGQEVRAMLDKPLDTLLAEKIQHNLESGNYETALQKLQGWTAADTSPEILKLYTRAYIGTSQFRDARKVIEQSMDKFSDVPELRPQFNALNLVVQAADAEKTGDKAGAIATFEKVFESRANLLPEMGEVIGQRLARLRAPEMEKAVGKEPAWLAADIAALIMRYGQDLNVKKQAANTMIDTQRFITWRLDLSWSIQGKKVHLPDEVGQTAMGALSRPLALGFDPQSPFVITLNIDCKSPIKTDEMVDTLNNGAMLAKSIPVTDMMINLEAIHPTLGSLFKEGWNASEVVAPTPTPVAVVPGAPPIAAPPVAAPGPPPNMSMMPPPRGAAPRPGSPPSPAGGPGAGLPGAAPAGGPGPRQPGATPAAGGPAPAEAPGKPAADKYAKMLAKLQKSINEQKYNEVEQEFAKSMADALPLDKTSAFLQALTAQLGKIQKIDPPMAFAKRDEILAKTGLDSAVAQAHFEKGVMDLYLTLDKQDKIVGLTFMPHAAAASGFNGATLATIQNMDSIKKFVAESLADRIPLPKVGYLPSRLRIPYVQEILREHADKGLQP